MKQVKLGLRSRGGGTQQRARSQSWVQGTGGGWGGLHDSGPALSECQDRGQTQDMTDNLGIGAKEQV